MSFLNQNLLSVAKPIARSEASYQNKKSREYDAKFLASFRSDVILENFKSISTMVNFSKTRKLQKVIMWIFPWIIGCPQNPLHCDFDPL